jgi:hypothetical protein
MPQIVCTQIKIKFSVDKFNKFAIILNFKSLKNWPYKSNVNYLLAYCSPTWMLFYIKSKQKTDILEIPSQFNK